MHQVLNAINPLGDTQLIGMLISGSRNEQGASIYALHTMD